MGVDPHAQKLAEGTARFGYLMKCKPVARRSGRLPTALGSSDDDWSSRFWAIGASEALPRSDDGEDADRGGFPEQVAAADHVACRVSRCAMMLV